jgi:hypothetical protein
MKILREIEEVDLELSKVLSGESNILAINNLDSLFDKIIPTCDQLERSVEERLACNNLTQGFAISELTIEELELARSALSRVDDFLSRWYELEEKHGINQEDIRSHTKDGMSRFIKALSDRTVSEYKRWKTQLLNEVHVSDADLEFQENAPDSQENAKNYKRLRELFVQKIDSEILTTDTIESLTNSHIELLKLKDNMVFDYPEDVIKLFNQLNSIGSQGQAPIRMLTKEVLEWMEAHEQTSHFYVIDVRIGSYRR